MTTHSSVLAENSMDKGTWQAAVHAVTKKSVMTEHACIQPIRVSTEGRPGRGKRGQTGS